MNGTNKTWPRGAGVRVEDKFGFLKGKLLSSRFYPEMFPLSAEDRVINLGCGEGPQAVVYAGRFAQMVGIDLNESRLQRSEEVMSAYGVRNFIPLCASVQEVPLESGGFDKAIAIGIMPCVPDPGKLCLEVNRLLKKDGELLISFPGVMYFRFRSLASKVARYVLQRKRPQARSNGWNPDALNQRHSVNEWLAIVEGSGFKLRKSRASTLFPPLHLYGVPRFWYRNNLVHKVDSFFCRMPLLKNFGQDLTCVFVKEESRS
jgi:ubiquinone/menaquinone biosynthesis C-methylase UbiE